MHIRLCLGRLLNRIRFARQGRYDLADRLDNHNSAPNEYIAGRTALVLSDSVQPLCQVML